MAGSFSVSKKCLAEFAAYAANKVKSIFARGVYLDENTFQAASVRVVRHRRTRSARSRLQKNCLKAPRGIFDSLKKEPASWSVPFCYQNVHTSGSAAAAPVST